MNISKDKLLEFSCKLLENYYKSMEYCVKNNIGLPLQFEKDLIHLKIDIDNILNEIKIKQTCECKVPEIVDLFTNPHCKKCGVKIK